MLHQHELYAGTILGIDCRAKVTREIAIDLLEPFKYYTCRIKVRYQQNGSEGFELINFDLPESYIGREVQVTNSTWRDKNNIVTSQEIVSLGGLEKIAVQVINQVKKTLKK